ncbi:MAG: glucan biosynthesis protein, partial [Mailhella sp.]|nr:glucan biosynthesis protein [Mailhella sp.]
MLYHVIVSVFLLTVLSVLPASAAAPVAAFTFADVQARAQDLARAPYAAVKPVPDFLAKMTPAEWHDIRFRPEKALWAAEDLPFNVQFFHPGLYYDRPVRIHIIGAQDVSKVAFDSAMFQYGSEALARQVSE